MNNKRWKQSNKAVYNIGYHIIWCVKYRRMLLENGIDKSFINEINKKARKLKVDIIKCEVMPDHVHLFIKTQPVDAPHFIIGQLKGYTSRTLRKKYRILRSRVPCLWTRSYYCESVGHISEKTIQKYIEDQKNV